MSDPRAEIMTGLSVRVANVELVAVLNERNRTARIEQRGETLNGDASAIAAARMALAMRIKRTRPDLLCGDDVGGAEMIS